MSRLPLASDSRRTGLIYTPLHSTFEAMMARMPGLIHWFDPHPDRVVVNTPGSELHWQARVGGSRFTGIFSASGGITKTTSFNSMPTLTANANGIFFPLAGAFATIGTVDEPATEWSVLTVVSVSDTVTRTLLGIVPAALTNSDPLGVFLGFNGNRMRRWNNDATVQAYSPPDVATATPTVVMYTWSADLGSEFYIDSATAAGHTISPSGPDFAALGVPSFQIYKSESQSGTNRFLGTHADIMIFDRDYSRAMYDGKRGELIAAVGARYGITIS